MAFGYSLSMRVTVLFFGVLKEMLSSESQTLDLPRARQWMPSLVTTANCCPSNQSYGQRWQLP